MNRDDAQELIRLDAAYTEAQSELDIATGQRDADGIALWTGLRQEMKRNLEFYLGNMGHTWEDRTALLLQARTVMGVVIRPQGANPAPGAAINVGDLNAGAPQVLDPVLAGAAAAQGYGVVGGGGNARQAQLQVRVADLENQVRTQQESIQLYQQAERLAQDHIRQLRLKYGDEAVPPGTSLEMLVERSYIEALRTRHRLTRCGYQSVYLASLILEVERREGLTEPITNCLREIREGMELLFALTDSELQPLSEADDFPMDPAFLRRVEEFRRTWTDRENYGTIQEFRQ